jgi:hypothetical protein
MTLLKFVPVFAATVIALSLYLAGARRLLVSAIWLALGLGFVMTRLLHAADQPVPATVKPAPPMVQEVRHNSH